MNARSEVADEMGTNEAALDLEALFHAQYERIARVIARVVRDPARAEELAVEVFVKLWRNPRAQGGETAGWLFRTAVRMGLDELRRQIRRARYERLLGITPPSNPEQQHAAAEEQAQVRAVLAALDSRSAELLVLRSHGLSYSEIAVSLKLNPASIGTLLSRAQQAFRKDYIKRYGQR